MLPLKIEVGQRFGRLRVMSLTKRRSVRAFACLCDCGVEKVVSPYQLRAGGTTSCGCRRREVTSSIMTKHGASKGGVATRAYRIWKAMRTRCGNPKARSYRLYGERGIEVCKRWRAFETFLADMGNPEAGMTIERIDNDLGYSPDNCRWASRSQQARNTSRNVNLTLNGRTMCLQDWANELGLNKSSIQGRLKAGWGLVRALSTPKNRAG